MSLGLYVMGVLLTAIGVITVGFGIPINEFSLGNTLIIAGTSAIAGGVVVIGLAAAVRQLNRIADALIRPASRLARPAEAPEPLASIGKPAPGRVPLPVRPRPETREPRAEPPHREPRAHEPRLAAGGIEPPEEVVVERPRPAFAPVFRGGEPPMVDDSDEVTLSPRPPFRPHIPTPAPSDAPDVETKWPPAPALERLRNGGAPEQGRNATAETIARATPRPSGLFDSVWPASRNANAPESKERAREPRETPPRDVPKQSEAPRSNEPQPVSILKSGVVDGMAYTLYTDGSIEAELAEGVVRFGSIEELRTHLEKSQ